MKSKEELKSSLNRGILLNEYIETWGADSYNRFINFKTQYPEVFNVYIVDIDIEVVDDDYEINYKYVVDTINAYYITNNKVKYLSFMSNIHKYAVAPNTVLREPEFLWDMLVKYNGEIRKATIYDYRKWKIKKILDD